MQALIGNILDRCITDAGYRGRAELLSFPAGKHDDQVDAQADAYRPAFEEISGDNWKTM
jgi:hypothetical protein